MGIHGHVYRIKLTTENEIKNRVVNPTVIYYPIPDRPDLGAGVPSEGAGPSPSGQLGSPGDS